MLEHQIKSILIDHLIDKLPCEKSSFIGNEIPAISGKRWIDILYVSPSEFHAYEVKSDGDSLSRLQGQIKDLNSTFDYTSVVVSDKYISTISKHIPTSVGILYVCPNEQKIIEVRKAQKRSRLNKSNLGRFVWKNEISQHIKSTNASKKDAHLLRKTLVNQSNLDELKTLAQKSLFERYKKRFDRFMSERGSKTTADDLINLVFDDKSVFV